MIFHRAVGADDLAVVSGFGRVLTGHGRCRRSGRDHRFVNDFVVFIGHIENLFRCDGIAMIQSAIAIGGNFVTIGD